MLIQRTNKINKILSNNVKNLNELYHLMEETAYLYVRNFQAQDMKFYKRDQHKLYKGIRGHFMVSDVDKITIYHRYVKKDIFIIILL